MEITDETKKLFEYLDGYSNRIEEMIKNEYRINVVVKIKNIAAGDIELEMTNRDTGRLIFSGYANDNDHMDRVLRISG